MKGTIEMKVRIRREYLQYLQSNEISLDDAINQALEYYLKILKESIKPISSKETDQLSEDVKKYVVGLDQRVEWKKQIEESE